MKPKLIYLSAFIFLIIGAVFLVIFNVQKGNTTLSIDRFSSKNPTLKFNESVYDFGVIGLDAKPSRVFKFTNEGQKELVIADVKSSCGCTAALLSQRNIPPGVYGEIKVTFDPRGYRGKIKKTVSVYSNDPNRSVVQLAIKGLVKSMAEVEPGQIDFGKVSNQEVIEKRIRVLDPGNGKLQVTRAITSSEYLTASAVGRNSTGGFDVIEVKVKLLPGLPQGKFKEKLSIYTNDSMRSVLEVPVEGEIVGPISFFPEKLFFGFVNRDEGASREVELRKAGKKDLEILSLESETKSILTKLVPIEKGRKYRINVSVSQDATKGPLTDNIWICTNNPEQSLLVIPVYALVR